MLHQQTFALVLKFAHEIKCMGQAPRRVVPPRLADVKGGQVACPGRAVADRWFPSSKACSACGVILSELPLAIREWTCPECGVHHDRDENAAANLRTYAIHTRASASEVRSVEDRVHRPLPVSRPMKQKEDQGDSCYDFHKGFVLFSMAEFSL